MDKNLDVSRRQPGAAALLRSVGLLSDGPVVLGRPVRAPGPGVYVIELPAPVPEAPIELTRVGKWLERVPTLRLDGARPTSKALAARLAGFWLPGSAVLYVGSTSTSIAGRIAALERHELGDRRPHAASHWLKTLTLEGARVWWAATDAPEEYEDAILGTFGEHVPDEERGQLHDSSLVLPFANLRAPTGERKQHGITGGLLPDESPPPRPVTRVVELEPGDAEGARQPERATGSTRRGPRPAPAAGRSAPSTGETRRGAARPVARTAAEPAYLSAEGLAKLETELDELRRVRRPEVIARIRTAKELGDLRENADYTAAREEQSFLEGRIQALEARLRVAVVIEQPASTERVAIGSRVRAVHDDTEVTITIVGQAEADAARGRISHASPVGRALLGRTVNEEVTVRAPSGDLRYRIVAIESAEG